MICRLAAKRFVMNQGIRRQYHLMIALLCAVSDLAADLRRNFGGSALLMQSPGCWRCVTRGGVAFCTMVRLWRIENGVQPEF